MYHDLCNTRRLIYEYMAYTTNPHMGKVRRDAVNLVKYRGWSMRKVALRFGVEPSTISRWCRRPLATGWHELPTQSSRPKTSPNALPKDIVHAIITKRNGHRRCGQVIHQELLRDGVEVSLPSVQRTLDRLGMLKKRSTWKRPHDATPRLAVTHSGALLQVDTIHIIAPDGSRIYIYTLIDLYSRWAYAEVIEHISAERSASFVLRAQRKAPFSFVMVQTDIMDLNSLSGSLIDSKRKVLLIVMPESDSRMTMLILRDLTEPYKRNVLIERFTPFDTSGKH